MWQLPDFKDYVTENVYSSRAAAIAAGVAINGLALVVLGTQIVNIFALGVEPQFGLYYAGLFFYLLLGALIFTIMLFVRPSFPVRDE